MKKYNKTVIDSDTENKLVITREENGRVKDKIGQGD